MDVDPAHETDFNAWYDEEHLPGLVAVPGVGGAARFRSLATSPRYLAVYELDSAEVILSEPWRQVGDTDWSRSIRRVTRNRHRATLVSISSNEDAEAEGKQA
jgi:hypothetical protein